VSGPETPKERSDRQLIELLTELRVALPGAQVLLGFLLTVPFATRFGRVSRPERVLFLVCLLLSAAGTVLLMAPSVYHRIRWERGGKTDVVRAAHRLFLAGSALLGAAILTAVLLVADVLFGVLAAACSTLALALILAGSWYLLPLGRAREPGVHELE
jgi:hypothetical protein